MTKPTLIMALSIILLSMLVVPVHASVSVQANIDGKIYVVYNLENLNSTIYDEVKANQKFNISTIPTTITKNLENQGLQQVKWELGPQTNIFDDATRTISVSFYLGGTDIISYTIDPATVRRTYEVKTGWRNFNLNLTNNFSINFASQLADRLETGKNPSRQHTTSRSIRQHSPTS